MATSIEQFNAELYAEHLSEASFLYAQRLAYLTDPEVDWPALHDWDERFEAHLDALVVGGDAAIEVCRAQLADGDAGAWHAALRLFCRHGRKQMVFESIASMDGADEGKVRAAARALCVEMPADWRDDIPAEFERQGHLHSLYAYVIGYRRIPAEAPLVASVAGGQTSASADVAWALGRTGTADSAAIVRSIGSSGDDRAKEAAAIALMRLGDDSPVAGARRLAPRHRWAQRVLGIGGDPASVASLLDVVRGQDITPDAVLALGLLGDLAAIPALLDLLDREDAARTAALALNTITGAQLHATVFVPYEFDPDELNDEERSAFDRDGTVPTRGAERFGSWERAPLQDKPAWQRWLEQNRHRFQRGMRWRMGQPYGPVALTQCLNAPTTPHAIRAATYDELVVRYRLDVPFEADLLVTQQSRILARLEQWCRQQAKQFTPGLWYFSGALQS